MDILGVDPGQKTGWGMVRLDRGRAVLVDSGVIRLSKGNESEYVRQARVLVARIAGVQGVMVIEDQHLAGRGGVPFVNALVGLVRVRAWWELLAMDAGVQVLLVHPQQWRSAVFEGWRGARRDEWKRRAVVMCEQLFGCKLRQDEAEAVLIALAGQYIVRRQWR